MKSPNVFDKIFTLPPVEKRHMVGGIVKDLIYTHWEKDRDDTYIYYLMTKLGFFISLFLSSLYFISYIFGISLDFWLFEIKVGRETPVNDFIYSHSFVSPTILLMTLIPYGASLFRANINLDEIDLLSWNPKGFDMRENNREHFFRTFSFARFLLLFIPYGSFALPQLIMDYTTGLHDSILFLLFCIALFILVHVQGIVFFWSGHITIKQNKSRQGPYYATDKIREV